MFVSNLAQRSETVLVTQLYNNQETLSAHLTARSNLARNHENNIRLAKSSSDHLNGKSINEFDVTIPFFTISLFDQLKHQSNHGSAYLVPYAMFVSNLASRSEPVLVTQWYNNQEAISANVAPRKKFGSTPWKQNQISQIIIWSSTQSEY